MAFDEVSQVLDEVNQRTLPPSVAEDLDDLDEDAEAEADAEDPNLQAQEAHLREVQAAKAAVAKSIEQWHGPAGNSDNLRAQVSGGKISPHDYFTQTGRVYSDDPMAGNLETAQADTSGLDALDNFQYRQANQLGPDPSGRDPFAGALSFSDDVPKLPGSIGSALSPGVDALGQTDGHAMAVDTLHFDTRLQTPTAMSVAGPTSDGTRNSVSPNNMLASAAWKKNQGAANAALRSNFKAAGLPDPSIGAAVLNMPGGGTVVQPGNLGAQQAAPSGPTGIPPGILRNWRPR